MTVEEFNSESLANNNGNNSGEDSPTSAQDNNNSNSNSNNEEEGPAAAPTMQPQQQQQQQQPKSKKLSRSYQYLDATIEIASGTRLSKRSRTTTSTTTISTTTTTSTTPTTNSNNISNRVKIRGTNVPTENAEAQHTTETTTKQDAKECRAQQTKKKQPNIPEIKVDLSKLGISSLRRYRNRYKIYSVSLNASKEALLEAVSRHFAMQQVHDEKSIIDIFVGKTTNWEYLPTS